MKEIELAHGLVRTLVASISWILEIGPIRFL